MRIKPTISQFWCDAPKPGGLNFFFLATDQLGRDKATWVVCRDKASLLPARTWSHLPARTWSPAEPQSHMRCSARWTSLTRPCRGQPLSRHHNHCHDRRPQFPVATETLPSLIKLCRYIRHYCDTRPTTHYCDKEEICRDLGLPICRRAMSRYRPCSLAGAGSAIRAHPLRAPRPCRVCGLGTLSRPRFPVVTHY